MKQKYFYSILLLFLGLLGFSQTLDQQNAPASIGGGSFTVSPSQDVGQSFTAGMTGDLSQINIRVGNWGSIFVAGDFQLRIIDGNGYGGTVLNTTTFSIPSAAATSNYDELAIVLSATVSITSGNMYTIDLKGTTGTVSTHGANPDYANGGLYFASGNNALYDGYDLWFKTFVNVPTPATHLNFDGINDNVLLPATAINNLTQGTIEVWVYPTASILENQTICAKQSNNENTYAYLSIGGGGKVNYQSTNGSAIQSISTIISNQWTHIAVAFTSTQAKIYINGILDKTVSGSFSLPNDTTVTATTIGAILGDGNGQYFTGNIDEVRVWNTARTVEQINGSMNCELQGSESGLVAYYQFNQGVDQADNTSITTLTDATSNGNDGTLTNFTLTGTTSNWLAGSPVETGSVVPTTPIVTTPVTYNQNDTASALSATTGTNGTGLMWYTTATGGTGSTTAPTPSTATAGSTSYWVASTNANGCESERVEIEVNVNAEATQLNFDGSNDYVSCGTTNLPTGTSARTIEAWIKTTQTTGSQSIINYGNQTINNSRFGFINASGNLYFVGEGNDYNTNTLIADGNWHHVAATYEASTLKIYIDGALNATVTKVLNTNNNIFNIGASCNPTPGEFFNGSIDEVRIWNVALSQTDIQDTMNCELVGGQNNVVAYYKFNQGFDATDNTSVTTLIDEIGNHNGTLINFALTGATSNWQSGSTVTTGNTCSAILSGSGFEAVANLKVYPNPSNGLFNISSQEDVTIEVYDMVGKVIVKQKITNGLNAIDISSYTSGIYLLKATNNSGNVNTYKIVKQ